MTPDTTPGSPAGPCHRTSHDAADSLCVTVTEAVAACDGVDPAEAEFSLYDAIDPDALDALFRAGRGDPEWQLEFGLDQYRVRVRGDGTVLVRDT